MGNLLRTLITLTLLTAGGIASAATDMEYEDAANDPDSTESLQRGARNFMNYCSGCHSAEYVRYNTIARHLDLSEDQVIEYLMFNAEKTHETIQVSMPADDAARWFGTSPPYRFHPMIRRTASGQRARRTCCSSARWRFKVREACSSCRPIGC